MTKRKNSPHHLEWEYVPGLVCCDERMREWRVRYGEDCGVLMYYGKNRKGKQLFCFGMAHERGRDSPMYQHPFTIRGKTYDEVIEDAKMLSAELFTTHTPKGLWDIGEPWVITLEPVKEEIGGREPCRLVDELYETSPEQKQ